MFRPSIFTIYERYFFEKVKSLGEPLTRKNPYPGPAGIRVTIHEGGISY